jgi:hypothetical protein
MPGIVLLLVAALGLPTLPVQAEEISSLDGEARAIVKSFFGSLKGELVAAMESGGPVAAIGVCNERAPQLADAAAVAAGGGWQVGRTSLKLRNPDNTPDAWETAVLRNFAARAAAGEDLQQVEFSAVVDQQGRRTFRYMKAIPTAEKPCLACHGKALAPQVQERLAELYPADQATGYSAGELRGAFTLAKPLD